MYTLRSKLGISTKPSYGFTIIEILVAIAGFTILMLGVVAIISNIFTVNKQQGTLLANQDDARKLVFRVMAELRNATTSNTGSYPLVQALSQEIMFYSNVDGGGDVERVRYFVDNGELKRGIVKPSGNPYAYNFGSESVATVMNNFANGAGDLFYYYDGSYNGVVENPLMQPVNVTAVKLIKMNVEIFLKGGIINTNKYAVTAIGTMRNLKSNLGD